MEPIKRSIHIILILQYQQYFHHKRLVKIKTKKIQSNQMDSQRNSLFTSFKF